VPIGLLKAAEAALVAKDGVKAMQGQHWVMLLIVLAVGYALGRFFPAAGQAVGLP
jgi:hypothetical protein